MFLVAYQKYTDTVDNQSPLNKPSNRIGRKSSLIELHRVESDSIKLRPQRVLQVVKDAKKQLLSQQNPRNEKKIKPRVETSECQYRGLDFTFAQNFSNKQIILKEFSTNGLRKRFFV
ncbi:unnamed protein product (macronuclear) [Paramecium tetraurelia]|uniref:Uncharacterized protein n=1 Tax=Paramecium tetraurelia TaxID=5888 RepID=A0BSQ1_PARTE|nr:uncharacterized protein GSPATT00031800001 [Paramecium tetraurelia]CAK61568.1 unnamed protein product [Paramecium tetraurelia]|eukprot:XP_001428966.1 hypothetical protein (macronuclear) [Paramecium tetraurelia strain d4-2]